MAALTLNAAARGYNRNAKTHQRANVAVDLPVSADDLNRLPIARK